MKRRDVLRKAGASLAGGIAATGTASASDRSLAPAEESTARNLLAANEGLLEELADDGHLDDASPDAFDLTTLEEDGQEGVAMTTASVDGRERGLFLAVSDLDDGELHVAVTLHDEVGFAFHTAGDETETYRASRSRVVCGECYKYVCYWYGSVGSICSCVPSCTLGCRPCLSPN